MPRSSASQDRLRAFSTVMSVPPPEAMPTAPIAVTFRIDWFGRCLSKEIGSRLIDALGGFLDLNQPIMVLFL